LGFWLPAVSHDNLRLPGTIMEIVTKNGAKNVARFAIVDFFVFRFLDFCLVVSKSCF
jgi:hypothetical protein